MGSLWTPASYHVHLLTIFKDFEQRTMALPPPPPAELRTARGAYGVAGRMGSTSAPHAVDGEAPYVQTCRDRGGPPGSRFRRQR